MWTAADAAALRKWYWQYLDWMLTSANEKDEHAAKNNHGTWYQQITPYNKSDLYCMLLQAFLHYKGATYRANATALNKKGDATVELLFGIE